MKGFLNIFIEVIVLISLTIWYTLETIVRWLIPPKRKEIAGMTAVVTGAGHGIGKCIALALAKKGVRVVLWDINENNIKDIAEGINEQHGTGTAFPFCCDVTEKDEVYEVAQKVLQDIGHVDILINNAGVVNGFKLLECSDEEIIKTMNVNVMAHFWTLRAFLGPMKEQNRGHIVAMSSITGLMGTPKLVDYSCSKSAVIVMMEALRQEVMWDMKDGVFFTTVMPSRVDTGLFDGCHGRFNFTPPTVQPNYIATKVVDAIELNKNFVILPPWLAFLFAVKRLLPQKVIDKLTKFCGLDDAVHIVRGHRKTV